MLQAKSFFFHKSFYTLKIRPSNNALKSKFAT